MTRGLVADPLPHEAHQALLLRAVGRPQRPVGSVPDPLPVGRVEQVLLPVRPEVLGIELPHLRTHPAVGVDAVRDVADGLLVPVREQVTPHGGGNLPVEPAHAVAAGGQADGEGGHVEVAVVGAEGQRLLGLAAHLADPGLEIPADELPVERLVAGGHGSVRREHGVALHGGEGAGEAVAVHHLLARPLEPEERDVALVHVPHRGLDPEGTQRAHAAHPEDDLLAETHPPSPYVEDAGDGPVGGVVERDVGVEHQHRHPPDLHLPHRRVHDSPREVDGHGEGPPGGRLHGQHGQPDEVVVGVDVLLEAVRVHGLAEVAGAVEEPHPHERDAQVARRLAVVAGQDPEPTRVDPERLVDPELHGEVGDRPLDLRRVAPRTSETPSR